VAGGYLVAGDEDAERYLEGGERGGDEWEEAVAAAQENLVGSDVNTGTSLHTR
jgi:hypothetical protein